MRKVRLPHSAIKLRLLNILVVLAGMGGYVSAQTSAPFDESGPSLFPEVDWPLLVTQVPYEAAAPTGMTRMVDGPSRLVLLESDGTCRSLTEGLYSACDPDVSFDGRNILFSGRVAANDPFSIWEIDIDGSGLREVVSFPGDCRSPRYLSTLYTLVSTEPWYTILFVGEPEQGCGSELYTLKLDGSSLTRLTYTLSDAVDPFLMPDGRIVFPAWQRNTPESIGSDYQTIFGVNIDGTDFAGYAGNQGLRLRRMPCLTADGRFIFIENNESTPDGAGSLGSVLQRRPLHSYVPLTQSKDGRFHGPSPLSDGTILVSRLPDGDEATYRVERFQPSNGKSVLVFDDPNYHDLFARTVRPRLEPDGRSSIVRPSDPHGEFYCLNVYMSDEQALMEMEPGSVRSVRLIEGLEKQNLQVSPYGSPPNLDARILGEVPVAPDGSFAVKLPANTPVRLQLIDEYGMAIRSCRWIWSRNREPRGCIGCHEDGELTPENNFVEALREHSTLIDPPIEERRTINFREDVATILQKTCVECHGKGDSLPQLFGLSSSTQNEVRHTYEALLNEDEEYVTPGKARTSPLIWHLLERNASQPWDGDAIRRRHVPIPPSEAQPMTDEDIQTLMQWIDMGAPY